MLTQNMIDRLVKAAQVTLKNNRPSESLASAVHEIERNNAPYYEQGKAISNAKIGTPVDDLGLATLKPGMVDASTVPNIDELRQQVEVAVLRRLAGDNERFGLAYDKWQNLCPLHNGPLSYAILLHLYEEEVRAHDARGRFGDVVKVGPVEAQDDADAVKLSQELVAFYGRPIAEISADEIATWANLRMQAFGLQLTFCLTKGLPKMTLNEAVETVRRQYEARKAKVKDEPNANG
jgi:hypothetical protein